MRVSLACDITVVCLDRCVIDVSSEEPKPFSIFGFGDDMDLVSAIAAEPGWIQAISWSIRILELPLEHDSSRSLSQRGVNLPRARNEPMKLECKERA